MQPDYRLQQTESSECGISCLAVVASLFGDRSDLASLRARFGSFTRGVSLRDLLDMAATLGLAGRAVRCELQDLPKLKTPAILHWGLSHFVVLGRCKGDRCRIFDPRRGWVSVPMAEVGHRFTGVAVEMFPTPSFQRRRERSPLKLSSILRWTPELKQGLLQVFALSVILQIYLLASPVYMQFVIDDAITKNDNDLLLALALSFGAFAVLNAVAETLRGIVLQNVTALLNWDMTQRLYHHLVRLPLPWFQRRRLADALLRFQSLDPLKNLIANGLISVLIDGVLSVATALMMFLFSPTLAGVTVVALAIYTAVRLATTPLSIKLAGQALTATIAENGKRIETLRAIQTIKVMAAEAEREGDWSNRFAETVRTGRASAIASTVISNVQKIVQNASYLLTVYLGARSIMSGQMTIGVLYAFISYQKQFQDSISSFVDQIVSWRMLDLYTFRLSDIVLTPIEPGIDRSSAGLPEIEGGVELKDVAFSYGANETPVLTRINLKVAPGEFVAITGASGSGKSTLLKVLCGLYPRSGGEILIDGKPLEFWGPRGIRRSAGVVMQDDELLSGSIIDNVTFFDAEPDVDHVWRCLAAASVDDEVRRMPMRLHTLLGDMGSALSGGQKQRILLARALYRRPRILILDEATSHLDVLRERQVNDAVSKLAITRLIVAHRRETIAAADRVVILESGTLIEPPRGKAPFPVADQNAGAA